MSKKLISTEGTEFAQNCKPFAIIQDQNRFGKPLMLSAEDIEEAFNNASAADKEAFKNILTFDLEGEEKTVNPSTSKQVITPSSGKNAITKCTVNKVTAAIDSNIVADNIKKGITILGVTGTHGSVYEPADFSTDAGKRGHFRFVEEASITSTEYNNFQNYFTTQKQRSEDPSSFELRLIVGTTDPIISGNNASYAPVLLCAREHSDQGLLVSIKLEFGSDYSTFMLAGYTHDSSNNKMVLESLMSRDILDYCNFSFNNIDPSAKRIIELLLEKEVGSTI